MFAVGLSSLLQISFSSQAQDNESPFGVHGFIADGAGAPASACLMQVVQWVFEAFLVSSYLSLTTLFYAYHER